MDLTNISQSRIPEALSKGENVKKLLALHISPYIDQVEKSKLLEDIKNLDKVEDTFLEWFGVLKGLIRPKKTIEEGELQLVFFNTFIPDKVGFSSKDLSKPLYFGEQIYRSIGNDEFKRIIRTYCYLTGFKGTVDQYSFFFKELFNVDVKIFLGDYDLNFIVEDYRLLNLSEELIESLTPKLLDTKNYFYMSPYPLFVLSFPNIEGSKIDFAEPKSSLYFPLKV